ncbi:hypothetical protein PPTG_22652 [Phytophthora nicotianae INRA-310]|uniref:Uncharacterized protein n=1 Tax=Phytophthora nicotianae (strain INRA-310) TaxID=761204 RepID=W2QDD5_PHYN3|nr:hypothetical protein PPTG_22652 [Phytophthora nicotianae INRA-310]ETN11182.1 hypothetical protein PPTG_22652 [Phytophthora nicotianae INRA-310]
MSQQKQFHHAKALGAMRYVYQRVVGKPLLVHFVMADADKGQQNAVEEIYLNKKAKADLP